MTKITAIRHAEVVYKGVYEDKFVHLTPEGLRSAYKLIDIVPSGIAAVYASPLPRCIETVQPICEQLGLEMLLDSGLEELDYRGNAQHFHAAQVDDHDFHYPGGESLSVANNRFLAVMTKLAERHHDRHIIVSTHGTVLSEFLIRQYGMSEDVFFELAYPDVFEFTYTSGCFESVRRISLEGEE